MRDLPSRIGIRPRQRPPIPLLSVPRREPTRQFSALGNIDDLNKTGESIGLPCWKEIVLEGFDVFFEFGQITFEMMCGVIEFDHFQLEVLVACF